MKCIICGRQIETGHGNNPWPVELIGVSCEECYISKVLPAQRERAERYKEDNKNAEESRICAEGHNDAH